MFRLSLRLINSVLAWAFLALAASHASQLPPPPDIHFANILGDDWLVVSADSTFELFSPEVHKQQNALHQWLEINPKEAFWISFSARPDLCLFVNNKLVFRSEKFGSHKINLSDARFFAPRSPGKVLLTIWHPTDLPAYKTFSNLDAYQPVSEPVKKASFAPLLRQDSINSTYVVFLLLAGLMYGYLRIAYPVDWEAVTRIDLFGRPLAADEMFSKKNVLSPSSLLFILAFALSVSLATVAIRQNMHDKLVLYQEFDESRMGVLASVLTGTVVVLLAMLGKNLFLNIVAPIFGYQQLVAVQYREFIRYSLLFGMFLPVLLLLYLSLGLWAQTQVVMVANAVLILLLVMPAIRIFYLMSAKYKLGSVQLFCYICTTEVIPLAIILKIIFLTY